MVTAVGVFKCVVDDCPWELEDRHPEVSMDALATVFGRGVMSSIARDQHHRQIEEATDAHLKTHSVLEWARTVSRLRSELAAARSAVAEVGG